MSRMGTGGEEIASGPPVTQAKCGKPRWKKILTVLASVTLVACNKPQPVNTKQAPAPASALEEPAQPRLATLAQQKVCAEQGEKQFHIYGTPESGDTATDYVSHYDARVNVCYMMIHHGGMSLGSPRVSYVVFDAFENRDYATYIWINSEKKRCWEVAPAQCEVKPRGQPEITCKSSDEFEELVDKYFGIGR